MFVIYDNVTKKVEIVSYHAQETIEGKTMIECELPENYQQEFLKAVETNGVVSIQEDTVAATAADKASRIAALNTQTWATIMAEAKVVYGSDDPILVLAAHSTYQDMVSHPADYVGAMFADQAAVLAYAEPKLSASSAFGKWRMGILAAEAAQKAAIEAE